MPRARLVTTAVVVQGRPVGQVADEYGLHRAWAYKLLARYRQEGEAAFEPQDRQSHPPRPGPALPHRHRPSPRPFPSQVRIDQG
jgi:hypothetical protein